HVARSPNVSARSDTMGSSPVPMVEMAFWYLALVRWDAPAAESDSSANCPWASADCLVTRASRAFVLAALPAAPVRSLVPSAACWAAISACLTAIPYFSMGSVSPRRADDRASTAFAVGSPQVGDQSRPLFIRPPVLATT